MTHPILLFVGDSNCLVISKIFHLERGSNPNHQSDRPRLSSVRVCVCVCVCEVGCDFFLCVDVYFKLNHLNTKR